MTTGAEFVANAGYGRRVSGDLTAQAMLSHYQFTRVPSRMRFNYEELVLTAGWRDSVLASVAPSPNTGFGPSPSARAISYDMVGRLPLVHGGHRLLRSAFVAGHRLVYGDVRLNWQFRSWQFDLSYIATNSEAKKTGSVRARRTGGLPMQSGISELRGNFSGGDADLRLSTF